MKSRFCLAAGILLIFCAFSAWAQTAAELEGLLDTDQITYTQAAWFTLASVPETPPTDQAAAFALALERGWLPKNAEPGGPVKLRNLSLLLMKAFDIEGGLMYRLFPGPRYAYREMSRRGFIEGRSYPGFTVSGERFMQILGRILSHTGDLGQAVEAPPDQAAEAPPSPPPDQVVEAPPSPPPDQVAEAPPSPPPDQAVEAPQSPPPDQVVEAPPVPEAVEEPPFVPEPVIVFEESEANLVIEDTEQGRTVRLLNAVYFQPDSAVPVEGSGLVLDELGTLLLSRPAAAVVLRAYTAPYGTREGRLEVSRIRADFCRDYLQRTYRIETDRIQIELYGADQLPEWGRGPEGNFVSVESFRCVEFILHE
jgi:outer membrane protein OmpA-like peptidoglycan-associated protein